MTTMLHTSQTIEVVLMWKDDDVDLDLTACLYDDKVRSLTFLSHISPLHRFSKNASIARFSSAFLSFSTPFSNSIPIRQH